MSAGSRPNPAVRMRVLLLACAALVCGQTAFALDPSLDTGQYAHTLWKIREGFATGTIHQIAQTPDGYLWLATEYGLLRFDGVRTVPWPPPGEHLPSNDIRSLIAAGNANKQIADQLSITEETVKSRVKSILSK